MIKKLLLKFKIYNFLRYNFLYYLILRIKNKEYIRSLDQDYNFFKKILIKNEIIFDIGSNQGDKAYVFSKLAKKVILFEPNKQDYKILNYRFTMFLLSLSLFFLNSFEKVNLKGHFKIFFNKLAYNA